MRVGEIFTEGVWCTLPLDLFCSDKANRFVTFFISRLFARILRSEALRFELEQLEMYKTPVIHTLWITWGFPSLFGKILILF